MSQFGIRTKSNNFWSGPKHTSDILFYVFVQSSILIIDWWFQNQNITKFWKMLKMINILQYQPFSQDLTLY